MAAVEAAKAAIENNRRQRELQDARIERALAGVDQANAQIAAAESSEEAVRADVVRTQKERKRQDPLTLENLEAEHGRGIHLMKLAMDEVSFQQGGTEVHMRKNLVTF